MKWLIFAAGDEVGEQHDEVAGDMCDEKAPKTEEADDVRGAGDEAEHGEKQLHRQRAVHRGRRNRSRARLGVFHEGSLDAVTAMASEGAAGVPTAIAVGARSARASGV
jgi:hypothetical protein